MGTLQRRLAGLHRCIRAIRWLESGKRERCGVPGAREYQLEQPGQSVLVTDRFGDLNPLDNAISSVTCLPVLGTGFKRRLQR